MRTTVAAIAAILSMSSAASAATFTVSVTMDVTVAPAFIEGNAALPAPIFASAGDRIELEMLFSDRLVFPREIDASSGFFVYLLDGNTSVNSSGSVSYALINPSGTFQTAGTIQPPQIGLARLPLNTDPLAMGAFDGIRLSYLVSGGPPSRISNVAIVAGLGNGAVPEPANWAMMIGGFALAGARFRRAAPGKAGAAPSRG